MWAKSIICAIRKPSLKSTLEILLSTTPALFDEGTMTFPYWQRCWWWLRFFGSGDVGGIWIDRSRGRRTNAVKLYAHDYGRSATGLKWNVYLRLGRIRGWAWRALESFIWWFNGGAWQNVKGLVRVASSFAGFQLAAAAVTAALARLFAQKFHVSSFVRLANAERRTLRDNKGTRADVPQKKDLSPARYYTQNGILLKLESTIIKVYLRQNPLSRAVRPSHWFLNLQSVWKMRAKI